MESEWNKACLPCRLVHTTCDGKRPCGRCTKLDKQSQCTNVIKKRRGRPPKKRTNEDGTPAAATPVKTVKTAGRTAPRKKTSEELAAATETGPRRAGKAPSYLLRGPTQEKNARSSRRSSRYSPTSDSESEEEDDDEYLEEPVRKPASGSKRRLGSSETLEQAAEIQSDAKRQRTDMVESQPCSLPLSSGSSTPDLSTGSDDIDSLPLLLDSVYSWVADLDSSLTDSSLPSPCLPGDVSTFGSVTSSAATSPIGVQYGHRRYPLLRSGAEHDDFQPQDGFDHECTCSSPHYSSPSTHRHAYASSMVPPEPQLWDLFGITSELPVRVAGPAPGDDLRGPPVSATALDGLRSGPWYQDDLTLTSGGVMFFAHPSM